MTLYEFAEIVMTDIELTYLHERRMWIAQLRNAEYKEHPQDGVLSSLYGTGSSVHGALNDLCAKIRGKVLILEAMTDNRREYGVPINLVI